MCAAAAAGRAASYLQDLFKFATPAAMGRWKVASYASLRRRCDARR